MKLDENATRRLVRLGRTLSADELAAGDAWYASEADWIGTLADAHGHPRGHAIAAYAALSPRLQLVQNRRALAAMLTGKRPRGVFGRNVASAQRALDHGERPRGPKTRSFACNLDGCSMCVTVDVWASRAIGYPVPQTERQYSAIVGIYRAAARRLGMTPRSLQAAVWLRVRGEKPADERRVIA